MRPNERLAQRPQRWIAPPPVENSPGSPGGSGLPALRGTAGALPRCAGALRRSCRRLTRWPNGRLVQRPQRGIVPPLEANSPGGSGLPALRGTAGALPRREGALQRSCRRLTQRPDERLTQRPQRWIAPPPVVNSPGSPGGSGLPALRGTAGALPHCAGALRRPNERLMRRPDERLAQRPQRGIVPPLAANSPGSPGLPALRGTAGALPRRAGAFRRSCRRLTQWPNGRLTQRPQCGIAPPLVANSPGGSGLPALWGTAGALPRREGALRRSCRRLTRWPNGRLVQRPQRGIVPPLEANSPGGSGLPALRGTAGALPRREGALQRSCRRLTQRPDERLTQRPQRWIAPPPVVNSPGSPGGSGLPALRGTAGALPHCAGALRRPNERLMRRPDERLAQRPQRGIVPPLAANSPGSPGLPALRGTAGALPRRAGAFRRSCRRLTLWPYGRLSQRPQCGIVPPLVANSPGSPNLPALRGTAGALPRREGAFRRSCRRSCRRVAGRAEGTRSGRPTGGRLLPRSCFRRQRRFRSAARLRAGRPLRPAVCFHTVRGFSWIETVPPGCPPRPPSNRSAPAG